MFAIVVLLAYAHALEVCGFGDRLVSFPADRTLRTVGGVVPSTVDAPGVARVALVRVRQLGAAVTAAMRAGSGADVRPVADAVAGGAELRLGTMRHAAVLGLAVHHSAGDAAAEEGDEGRLRVPHHPRAEDGHALCAEVRFESLGRGSRANVVDDALAGVLRGQDVSEYPPGPTFVNDEVDLVDFRRGGCCSGLNDADVFLAINEETGGLDFRFRQTGGEMQRRHELCRPSLVEGEPTLRAQDQRRGYFG